MKNLAILSLLTMAGVFSISSCGGGGLCNNGDCSGLRRDPLQGEGRHVVFVTAARIYGNIGGLEGADTLCHKYGSEGEKTKGFDGKWKAILSDSNTHSKDRLGLNPTFAVTNIQSEIVAGTAEALWNGTLSAPINYDQNGKAVTEKLEVWSGTLSDGTKASGPSLVTNCTDWNDGTTIVNAGVIGTAGAIDSSWIETEDFIGCAKTDEKARLYCINIP